MQDKVFLFLQGPCSPFFQRLGKALKSRGYKVLKVSFNGGDVITWPTKDNLFFQRTRKRWASWLSRLIKKHNITDIFVMGDWRPMHIEAHDLSALFGIIFHVFEEGYLRPNYITMENGGVNGRSRLPKGAKQIQEAARQLPDPPTAQNLASHQKELYHHHFIYYLGYFLLCFLFPWYRTHRPSSAIKEIFGGWLPRKCKQRKLEKQTSDALNKLSHSKRPFFLFPLQLDSDAQVRRYSPFNGMLEGISHVLTSFAKSAPPDTAILIKNHPLDYGLIDYRTYIRHYAKALNIYDRIFFIDYGNGPDLIEKSLGVVLLNSTIGMQAIAQNKPVYCLGQCIYAMPGLAASPSEQSLNDFWHKPTKPDMTLYEDFSKVLKHQVLINGNFFSNEGITLAVGGVLKRLGIV